MKTLILVMMMLIITSASFAQNVNIPDTAFLYALIDVGVDINGDSLISVEEAEVVTSLDVNGGEWVFNLGNISNMSGIEAFINLVTLDCAWNKIASLDVSDCTALTRLDCGGNQFTSLDVSYNTALTELACGYNSLTSLDVSNNIALASLDCRSNDLTSLDVSNHTALTSLDCRSNDLTSLDVSGCTDLVTLNFTDNPLDSLDVSNCISLTWLTCRYFQLTSLVVSGCTALKGLNCSGNQLTSLDVSNNPALTQLDCSINPLTSLDVSNNPALTQLDCSINPLTSLDVSNNNVLKELYIAHIPNLHEVCVWTIPFPPSGVYVYKDSSPNVYFKTDCSVNALNACNEENIIDIYPNPSDGIIHIENVNNAKIEIHNIGGALMFTKTIYLDPEKIDISDFTKGIYIVKVIKDNNLNVVKLVVK